MNVLQEWTLFLTAEVDKYFLQWSSSHILGFGGRVPVTITQLCHCSMNAAIENTKGTSIDVFQQNFS